MSLARLNDVLALAAAKNRGIPAFDTLDYETAQAYLDAAEETGSPAVMMVGEAQFPYINRKRLFPYLVRLAEAASVPVALQLDHGKTMDSIRLCIDSGFTSIMYDGSHLPYEENVRQTKQVVDYCHPLGISVEAEIGHVGGGEGQEQGSTVDRSAFTDPDEAVSFVRETGVDALAVAIGTVHGPFKTEPDLDFSLTKMLGKLIPVPLVMHGASGVPISDLQQAIQAGIRKINIYSDISYGCSHVAYDTLRHRNGTMHYLELMHSVQAEAMKRFITLFSAL
mgnify:CR=1 FL=1